MLLPRLTALCLAVAVVLTGCAVPSPALGPVTPPPPPVSAGAFVMPDGTHLLYRVWRPAGEPKAIVLALHGFNDSRDAFEVPGPEFAAHGIEIISPDQRGFGDTPQRGLWPGTRTLVGDARRMALLIRAEHPGTKLYLMGESMGAAVLMCLAASRDPPPVAGYILISPAVWGRSEMNVFERVGLWLMSTTVPGLTANGSLVKVRASDNRPAIYRLSTDPLTIHDTRWGTVKGLVDLMDSALADSRHIRPPALYLYGGHDELVPKRAARAAERALPSGVRIAYYPHDYHLMLRDLGRQVPIDDIIAWIDNPDGRLPSDAEAAARVWLDRSTTARGERVAAR
jgi:acylglycerol lipase